MCDRPRSRAGARRACGLAVSYSRHVWDYGCRIELTTFVRNSRVVTVFSVVGGVIESDACVVVSRVSAVHEVTGMRYMMRR